MAVSSEGIMLVDDPDETLEALCKIKNNPITRNLYKVSYEKTRGRKKPISRQHTDTHFYLLNIFKLLTKIKRSEYRASQIALEICAKKNENINEYQTLLRNTIKNSKKWKIFHKFLSLIENTKMSDEELNKHFTKVQTKTLIAWCKETGWLDKNAKGEYWQIKFEEKLPTDEDFFETFKIIYRKMNDTGMAGVPRIFINIDEFRTAVSAKLGIGLSKFDEYFTKLLDSKKLRIRLHGSPPLPEDRDEEPLDVFEYVGKVYHYFSIE